MTQRKWGIYLKNFANTNLLSFYKIMPKEEFTLLDHVSLTENYVNSTVYSIFEFNIDLTTHFLLWLWCLHLNSVTIVKWRGPVQMEVNCFLLKKIKH